VDDEGGFFQGKNRRDAIYLLALQSLAERPVGVFNTLPVKIFGKITACASKIIVRIGAGFPDT
jgi:hypothetical protein